MADNKETTISYFVDFNTTYVKADFKEITELIRDMGKTLQSEFKKEIEAVHSELEKTTKAVDETKNAIDKTTEAVDSTKTAIAKTAKVVNETKDAVDETTKAVDNTTAALDKTTKAVDDTKDALKEMKKDAHVNIDMNYTSLVEVTTQTKKAEDALDKLSAKSGGLKDAFAGAGGKIKDSLGGALSSATNGASDSVISLGSSLKGIKGGAGISAAALGGIGAAAADIAIKSVGMASDMSSAMGSFASQTGTSKGELDKYQSVLENIYTNNYGEGFQDIAGAMVQVKQKFGDLNETDLQNLTESAFALSDTFQFDIGSSTASAKKLMDEFGISSDQAMSMIAAGAQNGLNSSGDLLGAIDNYSGKFSQIGLDADDMFQIMQAGADGGATSMDSIGSAIGNLADNVLSGSESAQEGFSAIGLNAEEMSEKFSAGGESAKEAFEQTLDALAEMEDPMAQNQAGIDLFGTSWEDMGPAVLDQMAGMQTGAYDTANAMNGIKEVKYDDLNSMFGEMSRSLEMLLLPIGEALLPILKQLLEAFMPILDVVLALLEPIMGLISSALDPLMKIITPLISLIGAGLTAALQYATDIITNVFTVCINYLKSQIDRVKDIFSNIIDFVKNVFTGNWQGAWDNIKNIFANIWEMVKNAFKLPFNVMIGGINAFIHALNKIKIPDWVPGIGGKGFNIPDIPRLKIGMDYVPSDYYLAFLDKGERVLTAEENVKFTAAGGFSALSANPASAMPSLFDTGAITQAVKQGMEEANVMVRGDLTAQINADGRKIGDISTPYVSRNLYNNGNRKARCTT